MRGIAVRHNSLVRNPDLDGQLRLWLAVEVGDVRNLDEQLLRGIWSDATAAEGLASHGLPRKRDRDHP